MRTILRKITLPLRYWLYWSLDYLYVGFWQVVGFFSRTDATSFLKPVGAPRKEQIILLTGIYERWDFLKPVAKLLLSHGYAIHVIEGLGYNRSDVEAAAELVDQYIAEHDLDSCIIVAHSKGGLIGKYLLASGANSKKLLGMVAINTPFRGSVYAYALPFRTLRVFSPRSPLLSLLSKNVRINKKIHSLYSTFDPHIPGGSHLDGAKNIQLDMYGHFRILNDKKLHERIIDSLDDIVKARARKS